MSKVIRIIHCLDRWEINVYQRFLQSFLEINGTDLEENNKLKFEHYLFVLEGDVEPWPGFIQKIAMHADLQSLGLKMRTDYKKLKKEIEVLDADAFFAFGKWSQIVGLPASHSCQIRLRAVAQPLLEDATAVQSQALKYVQKNFCNALLDLNPWTEKNVTLPKIDFVTNETNSVAKTDKGKVRKALVVPIKVIDWIESGELESVVREFAPDRIYVGGEDDAKRLGSALENWGLNADVLASANTLGECHLAAFLNLGSKAEPFFFQAISHEVAIVSPATNFSRFFVINGENGLLYPQGDIDEFKRILLRLSNDDVLRAGIARAARVDFEEKWSREKQMQIIVERLNSFLSSKESA